MSRAEAAATAAGATATAAPARASSEAIEGRLMGRHGCCRIPGPGARAGWPCDRGAERPMAPPDGCGPIPLVSGATRRWRGLGAHGLRVMGLLLAVWLTASWTAERQTFHPRRWS